MALSLAQEGPGLHFMDHHLFDIMVERDTKLTDADVPGMPQELREIIQQVSSFWPSSGADYGHHRSTI